MPDDENLKKLQSDEIPVNLITLFLFSAELNDHETS